jgi:hypothetical protein
MACHHRKLKLTNLIYFIQLQLQKTYGGIKRMYRFFSKACESTKQLKMKCKFIIPVIIHVEKLLCC